MRSRFQNDLTCVTRPSTTAAEPADGSVRVQGYRMGQYRIETGADGVERAVPMADAGMLLLRRDGKVAERPQTMALQDLKTDLREIGERQGRVVP